MNAILTAMCVPAMVVTTQPGWSQTDSQQSGSRQVTPGGGGTSGTGVAGQPGNKSGVKGLSGNKSGPSSKDPGQNR